MPSRRSWDKKNVIQKIIDLGPPFHYVKHKYGWVYFRLVSISRKEVVKISFLSKLRPCGFALTFFILQIKNETEIK